MPITEHQRAMRQKHLGGSDAPRVLGVSPFGGRVDVYHEKTMPLVEDRPIEAMETGNRLEDPLIDFLAEQLGVKVRRNQFRVGKNSICSAHHDALVVGKPQGVQAKYVGPNAVDEWGDPGTDQVPTHVVAQVQHEMYVSDLELVWVPVFLARFRPAWEIYEVPRDEELIGDIVAEEERFWKEHVLPGVSPDPMALPPLELLKRLKREPGSIVVLDDIAPDLVAYYEEAQEKLKAAKELKDRAYAEVLASLGEAEAGRLPDGRLVTYLEQSRREYVCKASTFRVLKIKGAT